MTFIGDGNNVAASLAIAVTSLGGRMRLATPDGYAPPADLMALAEERARATGGALEWLTDPMAAARGADILYTDVWTSMGMEAERDRRRMELADFRISRALLAAGGARLPGDALPARAPRRGDRGGAARGAGQPHRPASREPTPCHEGGPGHAPGVP